MASEALIGHGTLFQRGDGATPTENFTTVGEVTNLSGPGMSRDIIDVTHMETADAYREYIAGLADAGEITVEVNYIPGNASQENLIDDFEQRVKRNFKIVFPFTGNPEWAFTGVLTGFEADTPIDDKISATFTIKITEKPTIQQP